MTVYREGWVSVHCATAPAPVHSVRRAHRLTPIFLPADLAHGKVALALTDSPNYKMCQA